MSEKVGMLSKTIRGNWETLVTTEEFEQGLVILKKREEEPLPQHRHIYLLTWLLRDFIPDYEGDGMIPCIIVPEERSSVFRQAKENTSRTGLNAIAMARQAALLLLAVHDYAIPEYPVDNDFFRQALELDLRGKRE